MLTLADVAEVGTAEIPPQWTPSVKVLAAETGLDRRTVQRHLDTLEAEGWIKRTYPTAGAQWFGERVRYALLIPASFLEWVAQNRPGGGTEPPGGRHETAPGGGTESQGGRQDAAPNQISSDQSDHSSSRTASKEEKKPKKQRKPEPQRDDVDALCGRLADRIAEHTEPRPEISEEWKRQARLLLDTDKRELDKALKLIEWCQDSDFWHTNILSMGTFRKQYEQLRLKANAEWRKAKTGSAPAGPVSTAPRRLAADEKCDEHRKPLPCGLCRAAEVGRRDDAA